MLENRDKNYIYTIKTTYVKISATPNFQKNKSFIEFFHYVWDYKINIKNNTNKKLEIIDPMSKITDLMGRTNIITDEYLLKMKKTLAPIEEYEYIKTIHMQVPMGIIQGSIKFKDENNKIINTRFPTISLDSPFYKKTQH